MNYWDVKWRRANDPELLECQDLTTELLVSRLASAVRNYGSIEVVSMERVTESEHFARHLDRASAIVDSWPEWKRNAVLGRATANLRGRDG